MKQILKRVLVTILVACILFSAGVTGLAAQKAQTQNTPTAADWMSSIADNKKLYEINIPGTHDSAMANYRNSTGNHVRIFGIPVVNSGVYACTQTLTVKEQLEAGVRFFDLRFSPKSGELRLCHGDLDDVKTVNTALKWFNLLRPELIFADFAGIPFVGLDTEFYAYEDKECTIPSTFETVTRQVKAFLQAHPGETVILKMKRENGETDDYLPLLKAGINGLKKEVNPATGKPYLYTQNNSKYYTEMPTLGTTRGQMILLCPDYEQLDCGGNLETYNGTGMAEFMGMYFSFHNHWDIGAEEKIGEVKAFIKENARDLKNGEKAQYGSVLYTSSNVVMKQTPAQIEKTVSEWLFADGTLKSGHFYGWFLSDFITAEKSKAIWRTNF